MDTTLSLEWNSTQSLICNLFRKWGEGCKSNCSNFCVGDCDKITGVCRQCAAGRKDRAANCNKECEEFEYGSDCLGNCRTLCNLNDCIDRVTGTCNAANTTTMLPQVEEGGPSFWYIVIIIIFSCMVIGALIAMMWGNQAEPDAVQTSEKVEQYDHTLALWDEDAVRTKRRRSGSNVDEPDAYNTDYMQQNAQFKEGKYWALSTLKTLFSPSALPDKLKAETGQTSRASTTVAGNIAMQATSPVVEAAVNVSDTLGTVTEKVTVQATTVLNLEPNIVTVEGEKIL